MNDEQCKEIKSTRMATTFMDKVDEGDSTPKINTMLPPPPPPPVPLAIGQK